LAATANSTRTATPGDRLDAPAEIAQARDPNAELSAPALLQILPR
tara:strand:- start:309 stop:443 length:135 start_codon:yes stop_codon:yes gene_type:complete